MAAPTMTVVAGPSGSGKSSRFPIARFGVAAFNIDDRCAELNEGRYHGIPEAARAQASRECEQFVADCIATLRSFAVETTLRSTAALDQAATARAAGFHTRMLFVATDSIEENIRRVARRAALGGHSATPERLAEIYRTSMRNLRRAIDELDEVLLYDNTAYASPTVRFVREYRAGSIVDETPPIPAWLEAFDRA